MKIAVYGICKDEEPNVAGWAQSAREADVMVLLDTGSSDNTVGEAKRQGVAITEATLKPFRFDDARNMALALVPEDVDLCVSMDLDERLEPGWRAELERLWAMGVNRPSYLWVHTRLANGEPGTVIWKDNIHLRFGYRWAWPIHEGLIYLGNTPEERSRCQIVMNHHQDTGKDRSSYLLMLLMAVAEMPDDERMRYYLAREFSYLGDEVATAFHAKAYLEMDGSHAFERASACSLLGKTDHPRAEQWLLRGISEAPGRRESWVDLADYYVTQGNWEGALWAAQRALSCLSQEFTTEEFAWGAAPYDMLGRAYFELGIYDKAHQAALDACRMDPYDEQLQENLMVYTDGLSHG